MGNELSYAFCCKTRREYLQRRELDYYDPQVANPELPSSWEDNKSGYRSAPMDGDEYKPLRPRFPMGNGKLYH